MMINPAALDATAPRSAAGCELMDQGYTILRGAASPSLIGHVAEDLGPRYAATPFCEGGFYGERTKRFGRLLIRSPHIADLVMNPAILDLAELALGNWCDRIQLNLARLVVAVVLGLVSWQLWKHGTQLDSYNEVTVYLRAPLGPTPRAATDVLGKPDLVERHHMPLRPSDTARAMSAATCVRDWRKLSASRAMMVTLTPPAP